ncbi:MAG: molecular chaperone DnaJ [Erythrobacter sp.]
MIKIAAILLLAFVLFRWAFGFWPWDLAKGPDTGKRRLATARRLLGVSARADRTEILAAHRLALTRVHPDRGGTSEKVHEVTEARDLLLADLGEAPPIASSAPPPHDSAQPEGEPDENTHAPDEREDDRR